jgi:pullulanase/glycogen debranching enzyme
VFARERFLAHGDVTWLRSDGEPLTSEDWKDSDRRVLGVRIDGALLLANASAKSGFFTLPAPPAGSHWRALLSSACERPRLRGPRVRVAPHSCLWVGAEPEPLP